jgi:hypothetical protein
MIRAGGTRRSDARSSFQSYFTLAVERLFFKQKQTAKPNHGLIAMSARVDA